MWAQEAVETPWLEAVARERLVKTAGWKRLSRCCSLTHSWSWVVLEKSPIVQLLKNFPTFYGAQSFITMFTRTLHWSLCWARSIQSIPSHCISLKSILTLSTHLRLGLPSGLFPSGFPPISYMHSSSLPFVLHALFISSSLTCVADHYLLASSMNVTSHNINFNHINT
jgi:hypothetical protein